MQSMEANKSKWILVYQDHLTKFCVLRALTSKRASEVAYQLVDIFLLIGAPMILQSDNGAEFTSSIIEELKIIWPDLKIIHGKPRHPQSQGSVERANGDIKDMLSAWLGDNNTRDWTVGIKFVQFHKNSAFHAGIQRSPYEAMFGTEVRNGLVSSSLPSEVVERLQSEDDLLSIQSSVNSEPLEDATSDLEVPASDTEEITPTDAVEAPSLTPVHPGQQPLETTCSSTPHEPPVLTPQVVNIQERQAHILHHRVAAKRCQSNQADRMIKRRRLALVPADIGNTVTIPIPSVDRGRGDPRNLMGKIVEKDQERELYKIAVRAGVLNGHFSRSQFEVCSQDLVKDSDINREREVSVREAAIESSRSGGQGFQKCNCSANQCKTNRCKCFKAKIKCNSRCHASLSCPNK